MQHHLEPKGLPNSADGPLPGRERAVDDTIVVRPGPEEAIKSGRTRKMWQRVLKDNIADALDRERIDYELRQGFGRIFVVTPQRDRAMSVLPYVFGVSSFSPVKAMAPAELEPIARIGAKVFTESVRGKTFAVRCKRQGGQPFTSPELERRLGAALNGPGRVDLEDPEVTIAVEALGGRVVMSDTRHPGPGGMPAGIQGRAVVLMSGGFDSAVAAWRAMRRGVAVDFVFCNLGGSAYERLVLQVAKVLSESWGFGLRPRFHAVDFQQVMAELRANASGSYWQVILKRQMYRAAAQVAAETGADALVTGESLGQVSSQTLSNLHAIEPVTELPVLRPLIGHDKLEIMAEARRIGTAPLSERVREYCALSGGRPVLRSRAIALAAEEARLDPELPARLVAARKVLNLAEVTGDDLRQPYLFVDAIPDDAVVIDCQPAHMYRRWHVPGAEHWDADRLARGFRKLPRENTYVLYCSFGTQTPVLAELMQQSGYEAYAFAGGLSRVQRHVAERERQAAE